MVGNAQESKHNLQVCHISQKRADYAERARDMSRVDDINEKLREQIVDFTAEEVGELAAGLIGVAFMRKVRESGDIAAADMMSNLSGVCTSLGMDARRKAAREGKS
jgi:hypothetical protein